MFSPSLTIAQQQLSGSLLTQRQHLLFASFMTFALAASRNKIPTLYIFYYSWESLCVLGQQLLCFVMLHKHEPAEPGKQIRCDLSYCTMCSVQHTCKVKCHAALGIMQCSVQFGDPFSYTLLIQVNVKEGKQTKAPALVTAVLILMRACC